jgi:hypothetical protein
MYRLMGLAHAQLYRTYHHMAAERGQGTVEYVALVLLIAGLFAGVVTAARGHDGTTIVNTLTGKIKDALDGTK